MITSQSAYCSIVVMLLACARALPTVIHVDPAATGPAHDGSSWCNAFSDLQSALAAARASGGAITEILVADGTYKPALPGGSRDAAFKLINGVVIRGGYAGCGATDPNEWNVEQFESVLSGDLNGNDGPDFTNITDNSYHVLTGPGTNPTAMLDGVSITGGAAIDAVSNVTDRDQGGGMFIVGGSPTIRRCTFSGNFAVYGAALHNRTGSLGKFIDCTFANNHADRRGGAVTNVNSTPTFTNCTFSANHTYSPNINNPNVAYGNGGAVHNTSSPAVFTDCLFTANVAVGWGDSALNSPNDGLGGAIFNTASHAVVNRCRFIGNIVDAYGGAIHNQNVSNAIISDCEFRGGRGLGDQWWHSGGAAINNWNSRPVITRCLFTDHEADHGAVLHSHDSLETIVDCVFEDGRAPHDRAGACYFDNSDPFISNTVFRNHTSMNGGAIYLSGGASATFWNCLFQGNVASVDGGAVVHAGLDPAWFYNCTFGGNSAGGANVAALRHFGLSPITLKNCILWGNSNAAGNAQSAQLVASTPPVISHSCIQGWTGSLGGIANIGDNPMYADFAAGDFRLTANSPCIDTGGADTDYPDDTTDLDHHARLLCLGHDMGAYEFGIGDFDCNRNVNLFDYASWAACFTGPDAEPFDPGCEALDFDGDQDVDLADFGGMQVALGASEPGA